METGGAPTIELDFMVQLWREGTHFIAHALPVDVISSGDSAEAARQALDEAVALFVRTAAEHGTLEEVLEEAGYEFREHKWNAPAWVSVEAHTLAVAG